MASRRSRIKGIANIPQRRKHLNEDTEVKLNEESENNVQITEESNKDVILNNNDAINSLPEHEEIIVPVTSIDVTKNNEIIKEPDDEYSDTKDILPKLETKPVIKRRFPKARVSLNAIPQRKKPQENVEHSLEAAPSIPDQNVGSEKKEETENIESSYKDVEYFVNLENEAISVIIPNEPTLKDTTSENIENVFQKPVSFVSNTPHSDTEYPLPPPSPSKANRLRIKAIPRLAHRKTSFSASESEDESRKINRIRNDSVCSTTSMIAESVTECFSPQRPKEPIAAIPLKKSGVRSEQTRKLAEARREFIRRFGASKPERHRLTMMDLIFYNPDSNPMKDEANSKENDNEHENNADDPVNVGENIDDPAAAEEATKSDEENEMPVPQIKIGPSGEIILDEQSLLIERKEVKKQREEMQKSKVVDADKIKTGYGIYKKHKRSKYWTQSETLHFYKALNTIGTDFMLMCELFPNRTRRDLKIKFKKEEKMNKHLIDRALMQPYVFDFEDLKNEIEIEERELEEIKKQIEEEKKLKEERLKETQRMMWEKAQKRKAELNTPKVFIPKPKSISRSAQEKKQPDEVKQKENSTINSPPLIQEIDLTKENYVSETSKKQPDTLESEINPTETEAVARKVCIRKLKPKLPMSEPECQQIDLTNDNEVSDASEQNKEKAKKLKTSRRNVHKPKLPKRVKKDKLTIQSYMSDSDADESDLATQSESDDDIILPHKPTRSGRMPKVTQRFNTELTSVNAVLKRNRIPENDQPNNIEPGSIMIITEDGPNGEPIYKIYMVTPEQKATPLDLSSDLIDKALQLKKGITAQNILTISANVTDDEEVMPEENNVTIPADENVTTLRSTKENISNETPAEGASNSNEDTEGNSLNEGETSKENNITITEENISTTFMCYKETVNIENEKNNLDKAKTSKENAKAAEIPKENNITISEAEIDTTFMTFEENIVDNNDTNVITVQPANEGAPIEDQQSDKLQIITSTAATDNEELIYMDMDNTIVETGTDQSEKIKIIATLPVTMHENKNFVLVEDNNFTVNSNMLLEVNSDGTCSKINSDESGTLRTVPVESIDEQIITPPGDDSVNLRTKQL